MVISLKLPNKGSYSLQYSGVGDEASVESCPADFRRWAVTLTMENLARGQFEREVTK